MTEINLISHHLCPYVQRAVIVLEEKRIPFRRTFIDLANKPDWFSQISPLGRVPVLETPNGVLFESQVIAEYLDETTPGSLHPDDPMEKARHRAWIEYGSETLNAIAGFYNAPDAAALDEKARALRARFVRIDPEIRTPFFAGHRFHMIDGVWGTIFRYFDVFDDISDFAVLDGLDNVARWRHHVSRRRTVQDAVPPGYPDRLRRFLIARKSRLSDLMAVSAA